jgi:Domain of unknown function (DUF4276)
MATKRPKKVLLFIEGTTDDTNGDLRQGFENLLKKELAGKMPSIKLGDGMNQTITKFSNTEGVKLLLIDLDADAKANRLATFKLPESKTFFMVQAMKAWFLSQPDILNDFYKTDLKIPKRNASEIPKPDEVLESITKTTKKGKYHKVNHAVELLSKLDVNRLKEDFSDVKDLIDALKKAS